MTMFTCGLKRPIMKSSAILVGALMVSACSNPVNFLYGNSGIENNVVNDQDKDLRRVDLALMLDPMQIRKSIPPTPGVTSTDADVIRARLAFDAFENNFPERTDVTSPKEQRAIAKADIGGKACRTAGRADPEFDETTTTKVTWKITRTRVDELVLQSGKVVNKRGKTNDQIDSVDSVTLLKRPKVLPADLCEIDQRMLRRRNDIVSQLIAASDTNCTRYMNVLTRFSSDVNFFSSLVTAGLGAAGALVTGGGANQLAAAAGAAASVPTAFNEAYFQGVALSAITQSIRGARKTLETEMRAKFKRPPYEYSIAEALKDVNTYHTSCSLQVGLEGIKGAVDKKFDIQNIIKAAKALQGADPGAEKKPDEQGS